MKLFTVILFSLTLLLAGSTFAQAQRPSVASVLSPPKKPFDGDGKNFDILSKLIFATGLDKVLVSSRNITVFAPNDAAFVATAKELAGVNGFITEARAFAILQGIVQKGIPVKRGTQTVTLKNKALVTYILSYHVLPVPLYAKGVLNTVRFVNTLAGKTILTTASLEIVDKSKTTLNPVVISPNLFFKGNVIVHVINRVLLPF